MATTQDRIYGLIGDLGVKAPVLVATTAPITLSGTQTIDGVAVVAEDRVLVKNQSDQTTNGIYYCQASAWVRAPDFDGARDCIQGTLVFVATGTTNAGTMWQLTTTDPVIGTSNLTFSLATPLTASTFIQTLLDDTTAAIARATLGAAALAGLSTQDFAAKNLAAAGTLDVTGNTTLSGTVGVTGLLTPGQLTGIKGTTTNNDANAGSIGEVIQSEVLSASAVSLVSTIAANVTSISLSPGHWEVQGYVAFALNAATSITALFGSTSIISATADSPFTLRYSAFAPGGDMAFPCAAKILKLAVTTTVYLVAVGVFSVNTAKGYGKITATRVR